MSATTYISTDDFETNVPMYMGNVLSGKNKYVVGNTKKKAVVMLSIDEYTKLKDPSLRYSTQDWNKKFMIFDKIKEQNKSIPQEEIDKDIENAVKEFRNDK